MSGQLSMPVRYVSMSEDLVNDNVGQVTFSPHFSHMCHGSAYTFSSGIKVCCCFCCCLGSDSCFSNNVLS